MILRVLKVIGKWNTLIGIVNKNLSCVVATVEGVPTRGDEKRPAKVMCNTGLNMKFRLTAFCVQQKEIIARLEEGQVNFYD